MIDGIFRSISNFFLQFKFWYMVEPWQQCLRVRLGKHVKKISPGFHFRIPYLDSLHVQSSRYRTALCAPQTLTSKDGKTVVCTFAVGYAIEDIEKLYQTLLNANDTITQTVSSFVADEVAITDYADLRAVTISEKLTNHLSAEFSKYGLKDVTVRLMDFAFIKAFRLIQENRWNDSSLNTSYGETAR